VALHPSIILGLLMPGGPHSPTTSSSGPCFIVLPQKRSLKSLCSRMCDMLSNMLSKQTTSLRK
jgi:hypothetical protein